MARQLVHGTDSRMTSLTFLEAFAQALDHHHQQRFDEAETIYRAILKLRPNQSDVLNMLGALATQTGRPALGENLLRQALAQAPGNPVVQHNYVTATRSAQRLYWSPPPVIEQTPPLAPPPANKPASIAVILCGQIRDDAFFDKIIRIWIELKALGFIDQLIYSTWEGELDRFPALETRLRYYGIEIIYGTEPKAWRVGGNYLHQTKQLYNALLAVDSGSWVFKCRPDVYVHFDSLMPLFQSVIVAPPPAADPHIFQRRIWVPYFEATQPFFLSDVVFFGLRDDLLRLCHFDVSYEVNGTFELPDPLEIQKKAAAAETRKYLSLFAYYFPVLNEYKDVWQYAEYYLDKRSDVMDYNFAHPIYWEYMALYFYIMNSYFLIGRPYYDNRIEIVREITPASENSFFSSGANHFVNCIEDDIFYENLRYLRNRAGQVFCNTSVWLDNVFTGRISDPYLDFCLWTPLKAARAYRCTPERRHAFRLYKEGLRRAGGYLT